MFGAALIALVLGASSSAGQLSDSAFAAPFDVVLNPGPGGRFASGGCMELEVGIDKHGQVHKVRVVRSSRYYQIDRAVLNGLKAYRFADVPERHDASWPAFFSWSADGKKTLLSNQCVPLDRPV
jgi:TonB family protein